MIWSGTSGGRRTLTRPSWRPPRPVAACRRPIRASRPRGDRRARLAAVARGLREPVGLQRLPLVKAILAELRKAAALTGGPLG